jgi:hypothetical protein
VIPAFGSQKKEGVKLKAPWGKVSKTSISKTKQKQKNCRYSSSVLA